MENVASDKYIIGLSVCNLYKASLTNGANIISHLDTRLSSIVFDCKLAPITEWLASILFLANLLYTEITLLYIR